MRLCLALLALLAGCDQPALVPLSDGGADAGAAPDAGPADAGPLDGASGDAGLDAGPPPPSGPTLYPSGRRHSPIPAELAEGLREVASRGPDLHDDLFMKVGDSITVSASFLHCFAGTRVDLDGREALRPTLDLFRGARVLGLSPFQRTSLAAGVGWSASVPITGSPSPLEREHATVLPRFAVVMFGTNDVGFRPAQTFARDLWTIVDALLAEGTIPLLSTIPPRDDASGAGETVPLYNLAIRAIAQGRGVPLVDYHAELLPLPAHGLGPDGVHPRTHSGGACDLTAAGLEAGANVRNLLTLEQLDRARAALAGEALDEAAPRLSGGGRSDDPFLVPALPFAAMGDTAGAAQRSLDGYGCSSAREGGPEQVYRVEVREPGTLSASVLSAEGVDADVHLLDASLDPDACLARDDRTLRAPVAAGTYFVVADTYTDAEGVERPGEYLLTLSLTP